MAAIQTFKNLQDKVLAWLDEAGDTSTTLTLVKNALNEANKFRSTQQRWTWMKWDVPELLQIVVNQQLYTLHAEYFRPDYFWNRGQIDYVEQVDEATVASTKADWNTDTGPAIQFIMRGRTEIQNQPTSASFLTATSSSGSDSAATVVIRGDTVQGVRTETLTAGVIGTVSFTRILKVTKVGTWLGTLTLTSNGGAVNNLFLFPEENGRSYQQIFFLALPDAADIVEYVFYRQPCYMSLDNDRPDVPTPFEELLVWDTLMAFAGYNSYDPTVVQVWAQKQAQQLLALEQTEDARAIQARTNYTEFIYR